MGSHRRLTEGIEAPQKPLTPVKLVSKIALIFVKLVSKIGKLFGIFEGLKRYFRKYYRVP